MRPKIPTGTRTRVLGLEDLRAIHCTMGTNILCIFVIFKLLPRFELGLTGSKPVVIPLHYKSKYTKCICKDTPRIELGTTGSAIPRSASELRIHFLTENGQNPYRMSPRCSNFKKTKKKFAVGNRTRPNGLYFFK